MQINYYYLKKYIELQPNSKFLDFDYLYDQSVTSDMIDGHDEYFKTWINDINDIKSGRYDNHDDYQGFAFTHFTKLAYLFVELSEIQHYKYPVVYNTSGELLSGNSRMLILTRYFPHLKWDAVRFKFNSNISYSIHPLIDAILQNSYWKNHQKDFNLVRVLLRKERLKKSTDNIDDFFCIASQIEFTVQPSWIFGKDWSTGADYLEDYDYTDIAERISRTNQLWNNIRNIVKNYPTNTPDDYKRLLDIVVLDNVEFVRKWREDFL